MSAEEIQEKMAECVSFINQKLRPELQSVETSLSKTKKEIAEYEELGRSLNNLSESDPHFESSVDMGHGTVFCNAKSKTEGVFVHVGFGFCVEMTVPEAIAFVQKRISFLQLDVLPGKLERAKAISDHMSSATSILNELDREWQMSRQ